MLSHQDVITSGKVSSARGGVARRVLEGRAAGAALEGSGTSFRTCHRRTLSHPNDEDFFPRLIETPRRWLPFVTLPVFVVSPRRARGLFREDCAGEIGPSSELGERSHERSALYGRLGPLVPSKT